MRINRLLLLVFAGLVFPAPLRAQQPQVRGLIEQAESQLGAGVLDSARTLLQEWRRSNPNAARSNQEQQARYHLLSARLLTNADSAEDQYLTVAVNFPTSKSAPEALLRLAQARHARGDSQQAATYLQRLLADYPAADQRPMAAVWLARVQPRSAEMCSMLRGVQPGTNPETIETLKNEITRVCNSPPPKIAVEKPVETPKPVVVKADTTRVSTPAPTSKPTTAPSPTPPPATAPAPAPASVGRVAIQVGAFRELTGARGVMIELQRAGFSDVRLVRVPGNNLIRVRIGRFENRAAASATLARLAANDISAVLVTDADTETRVAQ